MNLKNLPFDGQLPHPFPLVGPLLLEEVHHLDPGHVPHPLLAPQPDHPGPMEMGKPLQDHPHMGCLHPTPTCPLNLCQINVGIFTALEEIINVINYRFLTTETNFKALYIFRRFLPLPH